ncbi:MAG TPA: glycerophosphodiester phosphodiesterase family protein [Bacteroidia bacterium]|jgi:glycerophosphoryl diester phosphodiesterase|nr:glycerophosphodiester phosphodiesterase family protein [Bacteroidia bacterium]
MYKKIDIQGHRGARGLFPENTITSFIEAIKLGVDTLEMDVVISKDLQVVVSHEAWMNDIFCTRPDGKGVEGNSKDKYNLYKMTYAEIEKYDCGIRGNKEFLLQKKITEHKPLLADVIKKVEAFTRENKLYPIKYNIEIKSEEGEDGNFNPEPKTFVELVYNEVEKHKIIGRTNLQSFDVRILQEIKKKDTTIQIALLVENEDSLEVNLKRLGFIPNTYSPEFYLVDNILVQQVHKRNMKLIPWTVNEITDIKKMITLGVDGIISDYPDRVVETIKNL